MRHLRDLFAQQMEAVLRRYDLSTTDSSKAIADFWNNGAGIYFKNLRRIKLFVSRIDHSLARIGTEVNFQDFLKLELVRDVAPPIYDKIYRNPEYFYDADLAFEVRYTSKFSFDEKQAKQQRAKFYSEMIDALPPDRRYVTQVLETLFPSFAKYQEKFGARWDDAVAAERNKRLFHPRCFRQYFLLKVPSELFSQRDFNAFQSSINSATEEDVKKKTSGMLRSMEKEDFKRWHFVHRIETVFDNFNLTTARGLCRGLMENSRFWTSDSFEFFDAARCIRTVLSKSKEGSERQEFLLIVTAEATSTLCALLLVQILWREASDQMPPDLRPIHKALEEKMRGHYLVSGAPSVFEEFQSDMGKIEPIQLLMAWQHLGTDAARDQEKYLLDLFVRRPTDLNWFLKSMFRNDFMDDYTTLKQLINYERLSELIDESAHLLDESKVQDFRKRYATEQPAIDAKGTDLVG